MRLARHVSTLGPCISKTSFLRPLRRLVPPIGGSLDLTPLILIVLIQLVLMLPVRWLEQAVATLLR